MLGEAKVNAVSKSSARKASIWLWIAAVIAA
jgi:hypothetical protein